MSNTKPRAYVSVNKNRLKVYEDWKSAGSVFGRAVFLSDGSEFEIELDNPTEDTYLAKIQLNGKSISQSGIVLRPGEHIYLERYLDKARRFLFDTYEVPSENEGATRKNGLIKVSFYKEKNQGGITINRPTTYPNSPWIKPQDDTPWDKPSPYWYWDGGSDWTIGDSDSTLDAKSNYSSVTFDNSVLRSSAETVSTSNFASVSPNSFETGRVEEGSNSDQSFTYVSKDFNNYTSHTTEIKLLANSNKPKTKQDLRIYCTECGAKFKKSWKFCAHCGTERP